MRISNSFLPSLPITYTDRYYKNDHDISTLTSGGFIEIFDAKLHLIDLVYHLRLSYLGEFY